MKPLLTLLLSLLCLTAVASPGQPYFVRQTVASSFDPTSVPGLAYRWVASDITSSPVTNWVDRIQSSAFKATTSAPTLSGNHVVFDGTKWMTNLPGVPVVCSGSSNDAMLYVVFTSQMVTAAGVAVGATNASVRYLNLLADSTSVTSLRWNLDSFAKVATNTIIDLCYAWGGSGTATSQWTNGSPAGNKNSTALTGLDTLGADDAIGTAPAKFSLYEICVWTNMGSSGSNYIAQLHKYYTNTYKFTP